MESQKEEIVQKEKSTQQEEIVPKEEIVQEEDYPLIPPLPQRQYAVTLPKLVEVDTDGKPKALCSNLAEALEFLARFETTP